MKKVVISNSFNRPNFIEGRDDRLNMLVSFIGTNRTGKTSIARISAEDWKQGKISQGIYESEIIVFDPQQKFRSIRTKEIDPTNPDWADDCLRYHNSLVILDDYKLLCTQNTPTPGLMRLMHYRNEYNIDIMFITHNPSLVMNYIAGYITQYYIFFTNVQQGTFEKKIPCYTECIAASQVVNRYVTNNKDWLENGRGTYPEFPYCKVDAETLKVTAFNMNEGKL